MTVVGMGLLTAIIVVLQLVASAIHFGPFSITLCLAPIIVGAALYGWKAGAWLGFVFGIVVLFTDAGAFLAINIPGTVVTVLLKGALSGFVTGVVYSLVSKKTSSGKEIVPVLVSGIVAPIVNTGIFLLGCVVFFMDTITEWGIGAGFENAFSYMIFGLTGVNFLVELGINYLLSAMIVFIVNIGKKTIRK